MPNALAVELHALGAVSADGTGAAVDIGTLRKAVRLELDLAALSADTVLTLFIETSPDNATWKTAKTHPVDSLLESDEDGIVVGGLQQWLRVRWTITASGTATFRLAGKARMLYCSRATLNDVVPGRALPQDADKVLRACFFATSRADDYLGSSFEFPLSEFSDSVKWHTARLAVSELVLGKGIDPNGPDVVVLDMQKASVKWFEQIADGKLKPEGVVDNTPAEFEGGAVVLSRASRGWSR